MILEKMVELMNIPNDLMRILEQTQMILEKLVELMKNQKNLIGISGEMMKTV